MDDTGGSGALDICNGGVRRQGSEINLESGVRLRRDLKCCVVKLEPYSMCAMRICPELLNKAMF